MTVAGVIKVTRAEGIILQTTARWPRFKGVDLSDANAHLARNGIIFLVKVAITERVSAQMHS